MKPTDTPALRRISRRNSSLKEIYGVIRIVDTENVRSYDDAYVFGRAAEFDEEHGVVAWHVTDEPERIVRLIEENADFFNLYGDERRAELGPGFYVSAIPHFWASRSTKKWDFIKEISVRKKGIVLHKLREDIESQERITDRERETALRWIEFAEKTKDLSALVMLASAPYSIRWSSEEWLSELGIEAYRPRAVKVGIVGKFAELSQNYPDISTLHLLQESGIDGVFTRMSMGMNAEISVFRGKSVFPIDVEYV